jgi:AcrR family transcriptional regulator
LSSLAARKTPSQDRSRQRVERILACASEIFAETGFDAATMEAIAERARVSIGSLYQYFPNKLAVFEAIYEEYRRREQRVAEEQLLAASTHPRWEDVIDRTVDTFHFLIRTEPVFRAVWLNWMHSPHIVEAGLVANAQFAERAEAIVAMHAPGLPPERRRLVSRVAIEALSGMTFIAARVDEELARQLVEETKVLLKRYLAPVLREGRVKGRA